MTIAIGMLCSQGAVIAADSRTTGSDSLTHDERKIRVENSSSGVFVTAFSASDANAARMLLNDTFDELLQSDLRTLKEIEETVRPVMAKWAASYPHGNPQVEFILGAALTTSWTPERNTCGGIGLYHCEPPASMTKKHYLETLPSTYVAIGEGASITDPIYRSTFGGGIDTPTMSLKRIAYLMYRAKRDFASVCGGRTNAVFLRENPPAGFEILPSYLDQAERMGPNLDMIFELTSRAVFAPSKQSAEERTAHLSRTIDFVTGWRKLRFLTQFNQEIGDDGIVRQFTPETSADQQ
jgi:hypothetical protein